MERTNRAVTSRKSRTNARNARGMYVDGNTARRLQEVPERPRRTAATQNARRVREPDRQAVSRPRQLSREAQRNRAKAMSMGRGFVVFLAVVSVAVLFCCVNYLQLKSELTGKMKTVASLESELSQIKEENNAYESQVTSDVDLNTIKKLAIGRLGMNYPTDDQKKTYSMPSNSYVRQYQDVPETKR
ncbi:hypothetical protein [Blautia sp. MSJ-19]|uniref:hypothetical protein n=1 Tax=Blautia sp. MSJ-19 TaxID=2841517 RepID=UPI001C0EA30E|nr:hypothetical protein [Blautia sp. MSJ-19]MBU5480423.1 hypothetical protein [Blautia sp. MSJ-19]